MRKKHTISLTVAAFVVLVSIPIIAEYGFKKENDSALPEISIDFPRNAPPLSRDEWIDNCRIRVADAQGKSIYSSPYLSVQGRGHSTFTKPKKPYKLKLNAERGLLGLPAQKRYVLLANFFDHSLMRNALAQAACRLTSLAPTTPQGRFVRLTVNGEEQGVYYLCEAVRDMVTEETLLLEFDAYAVNEDKQTFRTEELDLPVSVRQPEKLPASLLAEVERRVNGAEANPAEHIDFDTFADYYLIQELCRNGEPNGPRSCFMHERADGRLAAGPAWDFDLAFNTVLLDEKRDLRPLRFAHLDGVRRLDSDTLYNAGALWYARLLEDARFKAHVKSRWQSLKPRFEQLTACIDSLDHLIRPDAIADQERWNAQEPARFDSCTTYSSAVATLRSTYEERVRKLDRLVKNL